MGRKPIGKKAMTGAELQRRYIAKLKAAAHGVTDDAKEIEKLRTEIAMFQNAAKHGERRRERLVDVVAVSRKKKNAEVERLRALLLQACSRLAQHKIEHTDILEQVHIEEPIRRTIDKTR